MVKKQKYYPNNAFNNILGTPQKKRRAYPNPLTNFRGPAFNVFNTGKKYDPVNLFGDRDRDNVPNVFDCKPNNPNKQGWVSAVVGAVKGAFTGGKGSVRRGWDEGMSKPGVIETIRQRRTGLLFEKRLSKRALYDAEVPGEGTRLANKLKRKYERSERNYALIDKQDDISKKKDQEDYNKTLRGRVAQYAKGYVAKKHSELIDYKKRLQTQKLTRPQIQKIATLRKSLQMAFPIIPSAATSGSYGYQSKTGKQGRGRPRGSVKYSIGGRPVGVFEYRRYMSAQRNAFKERLKQQQEMAKQQRQIQKMQSMPQYEQVSPQEMAQQQMAQQQAQQQIAQQQIAQQQMSPQMMEELQMQQQIQQVPQEVQGAIPEYSQFPTETQPVEQQQVMPQPQYRQYAQQYTPQPKEHQIPEEIKPVFKSSGGHPYKAVDRRSLTPTSQTVPYGYVESIDAFTGRRFMKPLPKPEKWTG